MRLGNPVISVDTKKKELVGNYKNDGRKWHPKGEAPRVQGHDFPHPDVPRAYPYGIYDLARNRGQLWWVPTMIPGSSPWPRSEAGGGRKVAVCIRGPGGF